MPRNATYATFHHKAVIFIINRSFNERDNIYEAARFAWRLNRDRAIKAEIVLAVKDQKIIGVFIPEDWLPGINANFPNAPNDEPNRWGFIGHVAPKEIENLYLGRQLPPSMCKRGASNPVRYSY